VIINLPALHDAPPRDGAMVDVTLRLPRDIAERLAACADDWNVPVQALVVSALQTEFQRASDD
jgi:hypothetical protein